MSTLEQILVNQIAIMKALSALLHGGYIDRLYQQRIDERVDETEKLLEKMK